jgi:NADP-dependent 3-hydroxy acid dehydrogenase YdfG
VTTGMAGLQGQVAIVTGASSGIGKGVSLALADKGAELCLPGRRLDALEEVAEDIRRRGADVRVYRADLTVDHDIEQLTRRVHEDFGRADLLVHSAGAIVLGELEHASVDDLDSQYTANVRGTYVLTKALLPALKKHQGQIVFINSSVVLGTRTGVGHFAATQHALRALADTLREEVNDDGVRVLSVFPGRTATPRQAAIHELEGKSYQPERLIQPEDVAAVIINAVELPRTAQVTDISIRPFLKPT